MTVEAAAPAPLALCGATRQDLEVLIDDLGQPAFRAKQVYRQIYVRGLTDPASMTDLSKGLREALHDRTASGVPSIAEVRGASDGTRKILFALADGKQVEGVLIPMHRPGEAPKLTQCVSTQVGCTLDCGFCLTGTMGLLRNLTPGEIVGQVLGARELLGADEKVDRLVYVGMGEPLANYASVITSLSLLTDKDGMNMSGRRITVSTAGMANRIQGFGEDCDAMLAVSINATTDAQRDRLMPRVNKRFPLAELIEALAQFPMARRRRLTLEYVLLADENDTDDDARRLIRLVAELRCKVNLIPYNAHPAAPYRRPSAARVRAFQGILLGADIATSVREQRGDDVLAACGQLGVPAAKAAAESSP